MNNDQTNRSYVITYKELFFTFMIFSIILFVLYPKDSLKEQILSEKSNYDLSMLYLQNLLKNTPEDESLMLILADQSLRSGNADLSLHLLNLLLKSKDQEIKTKATLLTYKLKKMRYFYIKDKKQKVKILQELQGLFSMIYTEKMYKPDAIDKWHDEALFVENDNARYYFLQKKIQKDSTNISLLSQRYYLEKKLSHKEKALVTLRLLVKYDFKHRRKWLMQEYYTNIANKDYKDAELILKENLKKDDFYIIKLAEFYFMQKEYRKSSDTYKIMYKKSKKYTQKRAYFYKLVTSLEAAKNATLTANTIQRYEAYFIHDKEVRRFMLKKYMAIGKLDYAVSLSKKILNKELR